MNTKTKILYIDDEDINVMLFKINFSVKFEVLTGSNGYEGLEVLGMNPDIKVIISDMRMPQMNGLEFIRLAKQKYPDKRFFILTGFEITEEIQSALKEGLILRYFQKPFNMKEIESSIIELR